MRALILIAACVLALAGCNRQSAEEVQANAEAGRAFLAENAKAEGVVTLPSGVQYKVVRSGPAAGLHPALADEVKVHYEGKLLDGTVFDSSYERGVPAAMPLRRLIPAWIEALQKMRPGDEWILYVPAAQGYGTEGAGDIPPNSTLIFRIELIDVLPGPGRVQQG